MSAPLIVSGSLLGAFAVASLIFRGRVYAEAVVIGWKRALVTVLCFSAGATAGMLLSDAGWPGACASAGVGALCASKVGIVFMKNQNLPVLLYCAAIVLLVVSAAGQKRRWEAYLIYCAAVDLI